VRVVAVLSTLAVERLFGDSDPIGKTLSLNGVPFEVIGVYKDNASFLFRRRTAEGCRPGASAHSLSGCAFQRHRPRGEAAFRRHARRGRR
jgi:hypothetical protein